MSAAPEIDPVPFVHEGKDGWLFLIGGSNFVTTLYHRDSGHLPDKKLALWRDTILERKRRCDELGVVYAHIIAPEKLTIYGHKLNDALVDVELAPAIRLPPLFKGEVCDAGLVDLVAPLRRYRDEMDLYWRTDTHWTPEGSLLAYQILCDALRIDCNLDLLTRPCHRYGRIMDLGSKLTPPVWEDFREITWSRDASRSAVNRVVKLLETPRYGGEIHVGAHAVFTNPHARNDKKILLFGDSFSTVDPHMFTALLAETVRELEFVWSANVDWSLVERVKPDILVTQIAERYMALDPNDRFNLRRTEWSQVIRANRRRFDAWRRDKFARRTADAPF